MVGGNQILQRKFAEQIRSQIKTWGVKPQNLRFHMLRIMLPLSTTQKSYNFKLGDKDSVANVSPIGIESRLKTSSVFFGNLFSLGLFYTPVASNVNNFGNGIYVTYPDKTLFSAASEAAALENVYNGFLTLKTDQDLRLDRLPTSVFRHVPRTQSAAASHPSDIDNFVDFSSALVFFGDRTNTATLEMEATADFTAINGSVTAGNGHANYLDLRIGGFEVVNGADNNRIIDWYKTQRGDN